MARGEKGKRGTRGEERSLSKHNDVRENTIRRGLTRLLQPNLTLVRNPFCFASLGVSILLYCLLWLLIVSLSEINKSANKNTEVEFAK